MARSAAWGWVFGAALWACTDKTPTPDDPVDYGPRGDCNPVDPGGCALPFPSSFHLEDDAATVTGRRVAFGPTTLPMNRDDVQTRPDRWNTRDGFSINSVAMLHLPGATVTGMLSHTDLGAYTDADVRSVIVDVEAGTRHPHWVELDLTSPDPTPEEDERLTLLRPAVPYEWNRTYVVGLRGVVDADGAPIAPSAAFLALRDGVESDDPDVERQRAHYEEVVFPALTAQGFARSELTAAWSFHTASRVNTLGDMERIREDALGWFDAQPAGPSYTLDKVEDRDCAVPGEHIARHIEGRYTMPYWTTADRPASYLNRDADGLVVQGGMKEVEFILRVPCSVANGPDGAGATAASAPVLQYGHGLLGGHSEVNGGYLAELADRYGWVLYASSWTGFASDDAGGIVLMIAIDPSDFVWVTEGSHQGMAEFLVGMRFASTTLAADPALRFNDVNVIDGSKRYYYGNSQGAILGSAYLAMSTDIPRGVLGVGGGPYSLLLPRSHDFDPFFSIFKEKYLDHRDITLFVNGLVQQTWDPVEPGGWLWDMTRDAAEPKQVLMQVGIGDNQVTTLGAHYQARAYGAKLVRPATRPVWGLDEVDAPFVGSALVEWEYTDGPDEPVVGLPPNGPDTHECPRRERRAQDQMRTFLETGTIEQTCEGGPCIGTIAGLCD
jgi:hypothetical protein